MFPIHEIDEATAAFPANVKHLMPPREILDRPYVRNMWGDLFGDWFYNGLSELNLIPKPGVDKHKALRHIRAVMGSFEPKHEDKEAACAYLFSEWFEETSTWKRKERTIKIG